jgi:hypothetical protein
MAGMESTTAGLRTRIHGVGALTVVMLLFTGSPGSAQEYRGTEEQRAACTSDVFRLCSWEIPDVTRIVACLRREKPRLSAGCREVFENEAPVSRAAMNNGVRRHHFPLRHLVRRHLPGAYEKTDARE